MLLSTATASLDSAHHQATPWSSSELRPPSVGAAARGRQLATRLHVGARHNNDITSAISPAARAILRMREPQPWNLSLPDPPHPSCTPTAPRASKFALGVYGGVSGAFPVAMFKHDSSSRPVGGLSALGRASCEGADYRFCLSAVESGYRDLREFVIMPSGGAVDTFIFSSVQSRELQARMLQLYDPVAARFDGHYKDVWSEAFRRRAESHGRDSNGHRMLERHESRWSAMAHVLRLILEAGAARGSDYARIYLTRPDIALWRPVDLRRYCDSTFYVNNCFPPFWPAPCLADFHFVMTTPMARRLVELPNQLGNATGSLVLLTQQMGNSSNAEFSEYVLRHVAPRWAPDHIVVQRHEEIRRMADGKRSGSPLPYRTRYERATAPSGPLFVSHAVRR